MGIPIARVELIDINTVRMVNAYSKLGLEEAPMLLMEFHGSPAGVKEQAELVQDIASEHGGTSFDWATTPEARTKLWTARHNAYFAAIQSKPGCPLFLLTPACPFPNWRTACWNRSQKSMPAVCPTSWSVMWVMETSTLAT
jgi:D-lactate dehydrogenase (cytochrome)